MGTISGSGIPLQFFRAQAETEEDAQAAKNLHDDRLASVMAEALPPDPTGDL